MLLQGAGLGLASSSELADALRGHLLISTVRSNSNTEPTAVAQAVCKEIAELHHGTIMAE